MAEQHLFNDYIDLVKAGYSIAALPYQQQKDDSVIHLPIFKYFLEVSKPNDIVLELGCGSGWPVVDKIFEANMQYLGVDICDTQIELAQKTYPNHKDNFILQEMLTYCKQQQADSVDSVLALFSIFHLPRVQHVDLFTQIKRILKNNGKLLFTIPDNFGERITEDWLGAKMYWSSFSESWYELTLKELGFQLLMKSCHEKDVLGQLERTWYFLCTNSKELNVAPILFHSGSISTFQLKNSM